MSSERRPLPMKAAARSTLDTVTDALLDAYLDPAEKEMSHIGSYHLPSEAGIERVVGSSRALLFPGYAGPDVPRVDRPQLRELVRQRVEELRVALHREVYRAHHHRRQQALGRSELECRECNANADDITSRFIAHLPELRSAVQLDLHSAFESDPAATGIDEILFCYPGTYAITVYRIAHALLREGAMIVPRMMTELAHRQT